MTLPSPPPDFRLAQPRDVQAAVALREAEASSRFLAGGTDLIVNLRRGLDQPALLIDLSAIDELHGLALTERGARIGACTTLAVLSDTPAIRERYRAVAEAAAAIVGPGTRALATVGGNLCLDTRCVYYNQSEWWRRSNGYCLKHRGDICHVAPQGQRCHAAFSGDLAPALLVFNVEVEIAGKTGRRAIALADLYVEDGLAHLKLGAEEFVVAVQLPPHLPAQRLHSRYAKARGRGAIDFPLAGVAVALAAENGKITTLRVGLTGTNARPFLLAGTDAFIGRAIDEAALRELERLVQKQVQPMRTTLASAQYRRLAAAALARRLAADLFSHSAAAS
jgi:4-hydroxybenzoyl-CoA reductase subunit beta